MKITQDYTKSFHSFHRYHRGIAFQVIQHIVFAHFPIDRGMTWRQCKCGINTLPLPELYPLLNDIPQLWWLYAGDHMGFSRSMRIKKNKPDSNILINFIELLLFKQYYNRTIYISFKISAMSSSVSTSKATDNFFKFSNDGIFCPVS